MKKIYKLSANLTRVHSRRYRTLPRLESKFPLRVTWVDDGRANGSIYRRQSYVFMRRYSSGISRSIFIFKRIWSKIAETDAGSILRWQDDGGGA